MTRTYRGSSFDEANAIVRETKDVREAVVSMLEMYLELSAKMQEFEDIFSIKILSAAAELFAIRTRRKRLEIAVRRIQTRHADGEYGSEDELKDDIETALEFPDVVEDPTAMEAPPDGDGAELDAITKERIHRAFRRIVLPRVHSDTSDADVSEFEVAWSAYKSRDYTLMEAFVIRYQDDIGVSEGDRRLTPAELRERLKAYQKAHRRLDRRLAVLQQEVTVAEIKAPEWARERIEVQAEKFRQSILEEAERIRDLEEALESLLGGGVNGNRHHG
jgi:hypothetical protein